MSTERRGFDGEERDGCDEDVPVQGECEEDEHQGDISGEEGSPGS